MKIINKLMQGAVIMVIGDKILRDIVNGDEDYKRIRKRMWAYSAIIALIIVGSLELIF